MKHELRVCDIAGEITLTYEEMLKYHGKDFLGGVALCFKAMELAFRELMGDEPPDRRRIRVVLGFNPPGVIDALEYVTRAVTQHRVIIDPAIGIGPKSVLGNYYFEFHIGQKKITMWPKDGLLPGDFFDLAQKGLGGVATADELQRWHDYKVQLGPVIINKEASEILEIGEIRLA